MISRMRILPLTILFAAFLLSVKVSDLWNDAAFAAPDRSIDEIVPEAGENPSAGDATSRERKTEESAADRGASPDGPADPNLNDPLLFSPTEIDLLQRLAARREELERRDREIDMREGLLRAAEQRVAAKVAELKELETSIRGLVKTHNDKEEAKLKSLVKIYENMKPKDAARIFDRLEMPVLMPVLVRMSERKMAPILAKMDSEKAKEITAELSKLRKIEISSK